MTGFVTGSAPFFFIHPDDLVVDPERQRKTFDEVKTVALVNSIREHKLINPLLVEELSGEKWKLIAGERRLRALRKLGPEFQAMPGAPKGLIPVTYRSSLSPAQRYALELEENIQREDLPWNERSIAIAKLHMMRQEQQGRQTILETATEVKAAPNTIIDSLLVANALEKNPELAKQAKSLPEAVKLVRKEAEKVHRERLAQEYDLQAVKTPHTLWLEDAEFQVTGFDTASFDIILTDPPYFIGADKFGDQATTKHDYDDSEAGFKHFLEWFPYDLHRVAKETAWAYVFCAQERYDALRLEFMLAGWTVWQRPLIWNKMGSGMLPVPDKGPRYTYETILYAYKGDGKVVRAGQPDVLSYAPPSKLLHAAQKPTALLVDLLSRVALPGARVLDLYAGSGSIFPACNATRCIATGVEKNRDTYNIALSRIAEVGEAAEEKKESVLAEFIV